MITSPPPPFTEYDDGTKNTVNNYPTNQIVEDDYDRLIKGWRNGTVGVAELLTTLGSLATDVIVSVRGRSGNSVDGTLKNALLGDLKSIDTLEEASIITHAQANALRKAAAGKVRQNLSKTKIDTGQQNKHIIGTHEYKTELANGRSKSILTAEPNSLTSKFGTGEQRGNIPVGQPGSKELVDFGKTIGYHIDDKSKKEHQ